MTRAALTCVHERCSLTRKHAWIVRWWRCTAERSTVLGGPLIGFIAASLIAGCMTAPTRPGAPRAMLPDGGVGSVFFPDRARCLKQDVCVGAVPAEFVQYFKHELESAGFEIVDARAQAPVARVTAAHVAASATGCTMEGAIIVADNAVEVKRTYLWPASTYGAYGEAGGAAPSGPETQSLILRRCLASFARTLGEELTRRALP